MKAVLQVKHTLHITKTEIGTTCFLNARNENRVNFPLKKETPPLRRNIATLAKSLDWSVHMSARSSKHKQQTKHTKKEAL